MAAVVSAFHKKFVYELDRAPCFADYRDYLKNYIHWEILLALASERDLSPARKREVAVEFMEISVQLGWEWMTETPGDPNAPPEQGPYK